MIKEGEILVASGTNPFGVLERFLKNSWRTKKLIILCDENTKTHCLPIILDNSDSLQNAELVCIPAGETSKNLQMVEHIVRVLLEQKVDRNSALVCLGGGVITDIGGFAASIYKRGIEFIHVFIFTTVL